MKRIIIALLLLCSSVSYADFTYSKGGINYENCKVKIIYEKFNNFEKDITDFCNRKNIIDIHSFGSSGAIIIYKKGKNK